VFLNRVAAHPVLGKSTELQLFLEATEDTWAVEMARAQVTRGALLDVSVFQVLCCSVCVTRLLQAYWVFSQRWVQHSEHASDKFVSHASGQVWLVAATWLCFGTFLGLLFVCDFVNRFCAFASLRFTFFVVILAVDSCFLACSSA